MKKQASVRAILDSILRKRIMIIDGATGSYLKMKYSESELSEKVYRGKQFADHPHNLKGNGEVLCITQPEMMESIHRDYLEAGADFVTTNTFNATSIEQKKYGLEKHVYAMNKNAAEVAKKICSEFTEKNPNKPRFVFGSIGPLSKTLSLSTDVNDASKRELTFDQVVEAYGEQVNALLDGGCDVLAVETIFDVLNAKAAVYAIHKILEERNVDVPIFMSATLEKSGRTLSGHTVEAFYTTTQHSGMMAIGMNCGRGADEIFQYTKSLSDCSKTVYTLCYPNAGLPNQFGQYDHTPEIMAKYVGKILQEGYLNMIGGCCGTTPAHIKEITRIVEENAYCTPKLRVLEEDPHDFKLCGLDQLMFVENFLNIGERCNVAGSRKFKNLIVDGEFEKAREVAVAQVNNGANVLDICVDEPLIEPVATMTRFVNLISSDPVISKTPLMIDSSKFEVLVAGLKCCPGKAVVNSLSLKNGEKEFIERAKEVYRLGGAIVVMAFDEKGQAVTKDRKVEICKRSYNLLLGAGIPPENIIFDTNVLTIATGFKEHDNYAVEFIETCAEVKKQCKFARLSGGVSNLSFALRGKNVVREAMHSVFLYHSIKNGLDMAIVNAGNLPLYEEIDEKLRVAVENVVLNKSENATTELLEFVANNDGLTKKAVKKEKESEWSKMPVLERCTQAIVRGVNTTIVADLKEMVEKEKKGPLELIEGPLMKGMNTVGELFGSGRMFLPQVIQSARVMKTALEYLTPLMEKKEGFTRKVLLATVKADVHDIGKNIVGCVLECNNMEVIDIGVMVLCRTILEEAKKHKPDVIGMSALITPSLDEIIFNVKEMKKLGMKTPVLIGGASTSEIHTAVKIMPHYWPVIHVEDASVAVRVMKNLFPSSSIKEPNVEYLDHLKQKYEDLKNEYYKNMKVKEYVTLEEARAKKLVLSGGNVVKPSFLGKKAFEEIPLAEVLKKVNWMWFFSAFGFKKFEYPFNSFPKVLEESTGEVKKLHERALKVVEVAKEVLKAKAVLGFFAANSTQRDEIKLFTDDTRKEVLETFQGLRQQRKKPAEKASEPYLCVSDFIHEKEPDYLGMFAGAIFGAEDLKKLLEKKWEDYEEKMDGLIVAVLCDRLAEALAEYMHEQVRQKHWGYDKKEYTLKELFVNKGVGIRPALGYPAQPDHQEKWKMWKVLDVEKSCGIKLTESTMMIPKSATCSLMFSNPQSKYFAVGEICLDQVSDYSARKSVEVKDVEKDLSTILSYK